MEFREYNENMQQPKCRFFQKKMNPVIGIPAGRNTRHTESRAQKTPL
jgi:hypothetical protein